MYSFRPATEADADLIAEQRCRMFQDNGLPCVTSWEELRRNSAKWLESHLRDDSYAGWLAEENGRIAAGAGVWFMEWPPHFLHAEPVRGYLMNFYVVPEARGHGLAKELLRVAVRECERRCVHMAVLHASAMGKPLYAGMGWKESNEMTYQVQIPTVRPE